LLLPLEIMLYGEKAMIAAFEADKPDFLMFAHRPTTEPGPEWDYFTATYGLELGAWMDRNYRSVIQIEDPERPQGSFGRILLLERRDRVQGGSSSP
jgi:hypothetical protein